MEVIARAAVQGGEKREEENKEYMPSTKYVVVLGC